MKKTFTVPEVPGSKRSSFRDYTHAIIGQFNYDLQLQRVGEIYDVDISNFKYYKSISAKKAGDTELVTGCVTPWTRIIEQREIDECTRALVNSGCETAEQYAEKCRAKRIEDCLADKAKNEGKWAVLMWNQSYTNAIKSIGSFKWYKNVKIVETKEVVKPNKTEHA